MQAPRHFLDYSVDGQSLYERHGRDFISCLGWLGQEDDERAAQRLLAREPADLDGRVAIYICPECADLLCGAVTVRIARDGDDIVWSEPAQSYFDHDTNQCSHEPLAGWAEMRFDANAYTAAIRSRPQPPAET